MRAVSADFRARKGDLESELRLHLSAQSLELFAEEFLDASAAQADDMRVLLFEASFVVVFFAFEVSQVQLVHQTAFLEQLQRAIHRDAVELGVLLFGHLIQALGVQMQPGVVDQFEQQPPLAREANPPFAQRILDPGAGHGSSRRLAWRAGSVSGEHLLLSFSSHGILAFVGQTAVPSWTLPRTAACVFFMEDFGPLIASPKVTAKREQMSELEHKKTILVVDDDATILESVRGFLDGDYHVLSALSGKEALERSRDFKAEIHLLLSDFQMQGMTGIELATQITAARPDIKVLLMSGYPAGMLVLNEGWHFLPKPFVSSQLLALVVGLISPDKGVQVRSVTTEWHRQVAFSRKSRLQENK